MKKTFRSIFSFILSPLEKGDQEFQIKPLSRIILNVIGVLFSALGSSVFVIYALVSLKGISYLIPGAIFLSVGIFCLIVGLLGNDRAVAKIWGGR